MDKPWEKSNIGDVVKSALQACPDQLRPYLGTLENLWTPRNTDNWYKVGAVCLYALNQNQDILFLYFFPLTDCYLHFFPA